MAGAARQGSSSQRRARRRRSRRGEPQYVDSRDARWWGEWGRGDAGGHAQPPWTEWFDAKRGQVLEAYVTAALLAPFPVSRSLSCCCLSCSSRSLSRAGCVSSACLLGLLCSAAVFFRALSSPHFSPCTYRDCGRESAGEERNEMKKWFTPEINQQYAIAPTPISYPECP